MDGKTLPLAFLSIKRQGIALSGRYDQKFLKFVRGKVFATGITKVAREQTSFCANASDGGRSDS